MAEENLWGEMLDVLKSISDYLAKEMPDATQEKASIDKPPRISEEEEEISGGPNPNGKPGEGFDSKQSKISSDSRLSDGKGATLLKAEDEGEEEEEEKEEEEDDVEEMKSLLKDIRNALISKSEVNMPDISKAISDTVKAQLPGTMERMLRKMGYTVTKPDVTKMSISDFGVDEMTADIKKSEKESKDPNEIVKDLSNKSWSELARMREQAGDFSVFNR